MFFFFGALSNGVASAARKFRLFDALPEIVAMLYSFSPSTCPVHDTRNTFILHIRGLPFIFRYWSTKTDVKSMKIALLFLKLD